MEVIPLTAAPSQTFQTTLGGRNVTILVLQRGERAFVDVAVDGRAVRQGALCLDRTPLLAPGTADFPGNLMFVDLEGHSDPRWEGYGSRFALFFYDEDEEAGTWGSL